jgi:hypothetical protein
MKKCILIGMVMLALVGPIFGQLMESELAPFPNELPGAYAYLPTFEVSWTWFGPLEGKAVDMDVWDDNWSFINYVFLVNDDVNKCNRVFYGTKGDNGVYELSESSGSYDQCRRFVRMTFSNSKMTYPTAYFINEYGSLYIFDGVELFQSGLSGRDVSVDIFANCWMINYYGTQLITFEPFYGTPIRKWAVGETFAVKEQCLYLNKVYECLQAHTVYDPAWTPPNTPALWKYVSNYGDGFIPVVTYGTLPPGSKRIAVESNVATPPRPWIVTEDGSIYRNTGGIGIRGKIVGPLTWELIPNPPSTLATDIGVSHSWGNSLWVIGEHISGWGGIIYRYSLSSKTWSEVKSGRAVAVGATNRNHPAVINRTGDAFIGKVVSDVYTISGTVTYSGLGLAGVTLNGLPGSPVTNASGNYSDTVTMGWSGTVTPTKNGYIFTPVNRGYSDVTANQSGQDYAAAVTYTISGTVTYSGSGLAGVTMNGLPGNPLTNASGNYSAVVPGGWSAVVTPTKSGYDFTPFGRIYTVVASNQTGQDYTAAVIYTISGRVTYNGSGLAGVTLSGLPGSPLTNISGNYSAIVPRGWSGTVRPTLSGYRFSPVQRTYFNVTANKTGQNYTAYR